MAPLPPGYVKAARRILIKAQRLAQKSIQDNTLPTYHTGNRKFYEFLVEMNPNLCFPLSDTDWSIFFTWLTERVAKDTASNYVSQVAFMAEIILFVPRPIWKSLPLFSRVKKSKVFCVVKRNRKQPVTVKLGIRVAEKYPDHHPDHIIELDAVTLFLTILFVGIYGLFRLGELIPKNAKKVHPEKILRRGQIDILRNPHGTKYLRIYLFRSKGDKFHEGVPIFLPSAKDRRYCPVAWVECLLRLSTNKDPATPLFVFPDGRLVQKPAFIRWLKGNPSYVHSKAHTVTDFCPNFMGALIKFRQKSITMLPLDCT